MRKSVVTFLMLSGIASMAVAQEGFEIQPTCQYTVLQNLIRDARSHERIFDLIRGGVSMDDTTITCGGSLLQLAIRRGNPSIINGILTQDKTRANSLVSLQWFPITEAPAQIPVILFAAYYAPSELVFKVLMDAGSDISVRDANGHDILWYLDKNPVLRQTATEDTIKQLLQNRLLENARKNAQRQMGQALPVSLKAIKEDTPRQLADPTLNGSTLATSEEQQPKPVQKQESSDSEEPQ